MSFQLRATASLTQQFPWLPPEAEDPDDVSDPDEPSDPFIGYVDVDFIVTSFDVLMAVCVAFATKSRGRLCAGFFFMNLTLN